MKTVLTLLISLTFSFAEYSIYYGDLKLGSIQTLDTVKENYLKVKITNAIAKFLIGKKELIYYNENYKQTKNDKNTKYKKDKYRIIDIIKQSISNELAEGTFYITHEKYIKIQKNKNYMFKYVSKGRIKSDGIIKVNNNELLALIDKRNHVKIVKN